MKSWLANMSVLLAALAAIGAALYALKGLFFVGQPAQVESAGDGDPEGARLQEERRRAINHLREIQFDRDTGKLDEADYLRLRARYEQQAIEVLQQLDAHRASRGGRT